MTIKMTAEEAHEAILRGNAPIGMVVEGSLSFYLYGDDPPLMRLPANLRVDRLNLHNCGDLRNLPKGLCCNYLSISNSILHRLPDDLQVYSSLTLESCPYLKSLPHNLKVRRLILKDCKSMTWLLPGGHVSEYLELENCEHLEYLPAQLKVRTLILARGMKIKILPPDIQVAKHLSIQRCDTLESVPALTVKTLDLAGCTLLRELPDGLRVRFLDISNCTALERWPSDGIPGLRQLYMAGCVSMRSLPPNLRQLDELDLRECVNIQMPPERLRVTGWLDIGGLSWRSLPLSNRGFRLRWRGIPLSGRIIFHPETITAAEVLAEPNLEVRRVMMEHMQYERFFREANAEICDEDTDAGGPRRLLMVRIDHDEPLVCLSVRDPSTGRQYLIRVPPSMSTSHQAAAWIAGFDDPDKYHPIAET